MAVDLIDYLISPSAGSRELCLDEKEGEDLLIKRYLYYWTSLSPHPVRRPAWPMKLRAWHAEREAYLLTILILLPFA